MRLLRISIQFLDVNEIFRTSNEFDCSKLPNVVLTNYIRGDVLNQLEPDNSREVFVTNNYLGFTLVIISNKNFPRFIRVLTII